ncbi:MAG: hypothetical protein CVU42_01165 [Chloroflexi bacterium HGW-Chloroflexi-4]|jgi:hypothetical protein|nr:MAG: hypothetical protein CVU42_01165 [Chloroflexi bacterium HGW-Chloroflexi-4]
MAITKKLHWFWAWEDDKVEVWLREMSKQGWHFKSAGFPASFNFEQGEPGDYTYRLDYFVNRKDIQNYLQLFHDAGWLYLGEMGGWQYFCQKGLIGEEQEIYSDKESKTKKYLVLLLYMIIFFPILFTFILLLSRMTNDLVQAFTFIMAVLMSVYVYAMVQLLRRISKLRKIF